MKGKNSITFNPATMCEVVQHYFDTVLFVSGKSPKVADIEHDRDGYTSTYTIHTDDTTDDRSP